MIVGFNIRGLNAERKEGGGQGNLQVNYSPEIKNIEETSVSAMDEKVAKIDFSFTVSYDVGNSTDAEIEMEGNILWKGNLEQIMDEWEDNEQLPEEIRAPLMNDLYRKCISQAVGVADTLGLLPPIPTPRIDQ